MTQFSFFTVSFQLRDHQITAASGEASEVEVDDDDDLLTTEIKSNIQLKYNNKSIPSHASGSLLP